MFVKQQPEGGARKNSQQRKWKDHAAAVVEGDRRQCTTIVEDRQMMTMNGFDSLQSQVTFKKANLVKWLA
jgi:hypothetical protein